jgi:uncharacterized protein (TIGR02118 family)
VTSEGKSIVFKAIILLKRKTGVSTEEFRSWWLERHAPMARQLPGVRRLCFNLAAGDGAAEFDGVSELWFDSQAAFDAAYASEIGRKVAADSLANVGRRERLFVEEHVIVDGP